MQKAPIFAVVGALIVAAFACGDEDAGNGGASRSGGSSSGGGSTLDDGSVAPSEACKSEDGSGAVAAPTFVRNIKTGETGWYASPAVADLDGDGAMEIVAALYSTFVFSADGAARGAKGTATKGRVFAPHVVADLDGDGNMEVVVAGGDGTVAAYELAGGALAVKEGWPSSTCSGGQCPEGRGVAAGDLDGDGAIEIVVTTTNTSSTGAQVFVFEPDGSVRPGWPRYDYEAGSDLDVHGQGHRGYGCYGENVGIGNIDDDPALEVIVTYDNHHIQAFKADGDAIDASPWYTNRSNEWSGQRMTWGQLIRWADPKIEDDHHHAHTGEWPHPKTAMWLQWTASPPNVVDIDGDGKNEVVGVPNTEMHEPYETQSFAFMVLEGAHGDGSRSARRKAGFEALPTSDKPAVRQGGDYYPPSGIPAPTTVNIVGDAKPEILAPINDGFIYAIGPDGARLWRYDYAKGKPKTFASEVVVADLNKDGVPEIVFNTYSLEANGGHLVVLANTGALLHDVELPNQGKNGNGIGAASAPTIADLDGDGQVEILVQTFDHGIDIFTVPGSGEACLLWPTARGNLLRDGTSASTAR